MKFTILTILLLGLAACANKHTDDNQPTHQIQPNCSTPPAPQNIWKLEPMLQKKGLITEGMSKETKEKIIRDYINKKNTAYTNCTKRKVV